MIVDSASSADPVPQTAEAAGRATPSHLTGFVFGLFFIFGGITSLNDVIIPKLKGLFTLNHEQAMFVQSAFFAAYFFISVPAAAIVQRLGYMRTAVLGLLTMTAGCLLFVPASSSGQYPMFLLALFVLAAGITVVQVVANPLISMLGPPRTASARLTFAQAFNSLGTTVFPFVGAILVLGELSKVDPATLKGAALAAFRAEGSGVIARGYLYLAAALAVVATVVWTQRRSLVEAPVERTHPIRAFTLLARPRFAFGALCIFLYVGAEVAIGSLIVNYLEQADVLGLGPEAAGKHVPLYWGGAMVGRFIGAWLLRVVAPGRALAGAAAVLLALLATASQTTGAVSGYALLAVGLFNSIMFPTIFTLASEGLGGRTPEGSGVICVAIVGGAVIPPLAGRLADLTSLRGALALPALCYGAIAAYGLYAARRNKPIALAAEPRNAEAAARVQSSRP